MAHSCKKQHERAKAPVRRLILTEVPQTTKFAIAAFMTEDILLSRYLYFTPDADKSVLFKQRMWLGGCLQLAISVWQRSAWTVGAHHPNGIMQYVEPHAVSSPHQRAVLRALGTLWQAFTLLDSAEQRKRQDEWSSALAGAVADVLGPAVEDMIELKILAVDPALQGRGYGSALVEALAEKADAEGRTVWLTTNQSTAPFYQQFGFSTLADIPLGKENPTYDGPPVIVVLMTRRPDSEKA